MTSARNSPVLALSQIRSGKGSRTNPSYCSPYPIGSENDPYCPLEVGQIGFYKATACNGSDPDVMNVSTLTLRLTDLTSTNGQRLEQITFALFMGSLITLLVLLYADVPIVGL
jgi:hypothetical protein